MKTIRRTLFAAIVLSLAALAVQAQTATLLDLSTNAPITNFFVGRGPQAVAWAGNLLAYAVNRDDNTLVRIDLSSASPSVTALFQLPQGFRPHAVAVNPAGTRVLVAGDGNFAYLINVAAEPFSIVDALSVTADAGGVAFYADGARAIIVNQAIFRSVNLSTVPATITSIALGAEGIAVAVNAAGTLAVVSLASGGAQAVDLTTNPPSLVGAAVGSESDTLGIGMSDDGTRAIYVDQSTPAREANVVDLTGTPSIANIVFLPTLAAPSAVAFNPVTGTALIAGDDGVAVLPPPYTAVSATIRHPGRHGATPYSIAVNPAGTRALVLHEDPFFCNFPIAFGNVQVGSIASLTASCQNTDISAITVSSITSTGTDFSLLGVPATPLVVPAGGTITFTVRFAPAAEGLHTGTLTVDTTRAFTVHVDLSGNAVVSGCTQDATTMCLNGNRFKVQVAWHVPSQGSSGAGKAVKLTADTGYFWFFSPNNVELMLKVVDGRVVNDSFWVFYGALSDVEYTITVTDTLTSTVKTYANSSGHLASVADTSAFPQAAPAGKREDRDAAGARETTLAEVERFFSPPRREPKRDLLTATACTDGPTTLCLNASRFQVQVTWRVPAQGTNGVGQAVKLTGDTGYFWFFSGNNVELVIKAVDGRAFNDKFWIFYGALSDVEYTITVRDMVTGATKTYQNTSGHLASVADTSAF
ncbi:MAG: choice-of-anchor D domain-containing protein [Acidobacteriota bacterium]